MHKMFTAWTRLRHSRRVDRHRHPQWVAAALGALLWCLPACAQSWGLTELMAQLRNQPQQEARFEERKYVALLDAPVVARGELRWAPPDRLEKLTHSPRKESLRLAGDALTLEREGKAPLHLKLDAYPQVAAFVTSVRATLTGDAAALRQSFDVALSGDEARWTLTLKPTQGRTKQVIERVRMQGRGGQITFIAFDQPGGDRTEMDIAPISDPRP